MFTQFLRAMERPELAQDPRFEDLQARRRNIDALLEELQTWMFTFDSVEVLERVLAEAGLSTGRVRTLDEVGALPWVAERGAVRTVSDRGDGSFRIANTPWRFSAAETGLTGSIAYRGEHNAAVLKEWLGFDDGQIEALEADGVLSSRLPPGTGS